MGMWKKLPFQQTVKFKKPKKERTGEFYAREFPEVEILTGKDAEADHRLRKEARKRKHAERHAKQDIAKIKAAQDA